MPSTKPRITIRTEQDIIDKISFIAEENERSVNQEITFLIKKRIKEYESQHGNINIGDVTITGNTGNISIGSNNK